MAMILDSRLEPAETLLSATKVPIAMMISPSITRAIELGAFPAIGMNLVTWLALGIATPRNLVGALQHFSAGILLTTIAKELLPEMVKAEGLWQNLASGIGFFAGVGVLMLLGILLPEEEAVTAVVTNSTSESLPSVEKATLTSSPETSFQSPPSVRPLRNRRMSKKTEAYILEEISSMPNAKRNDLKERYALVSALPLALLTAVAIDSALDGLLIGISTAVDPKTGPLLSASLTVESSFLGLTIAAALRGSSAPTALLLMAASLAPLGIIAGSISGGGLAPMLAENPVLFTGFLGFGTSTTLFMVAEELLLEAHEDGSEHVWWVDLQLYTGFFASVMIEKMFGM